MLSQRQAGAQLGLCREGGSSANRCDAFLFPKIRPSLGYVDVLKMPIISSLFPDGFLNILTRKPLMWQAFVANALAPSPLHADHDRQSQE